MTDRGTEGTRGLAWFRGTDNGGGILAPQLQGKGRRESRKSVHAHGWSLCSLTSSFNLAVVHTSNLGTQMCLHGAWGGREGGTVTKGVP